MWSLRRKNREQEVIETAPGQQKMWLVWLLSIVTFAVTVAVVLGLFWGGRWLVNRIKHKSNPTPAAPAINNDRGTSSPTQAPSSNGSGSAGANTSPSTPAPNPSPSTPTPTTTPTTQQTAPASPTSLVNTGPTSDE